MSDRVNYPLIRDSILSQDPSLYHLYDTSANFHHHFDVLIGMLVPMVRGLAETCRDADARHEEAVREAMRTPPTFDIPLRVLFSEDDLPGGEG